MNTPAHLLIGAAVMGRGGDRKLIWAAMTGGFLPDLSLYLMAGVSMFYLNISPHRVFNELYFSDAWMAVFAVDNSFILWGILLGVAVWYRSGWAIALTGAALLHLVLDFPLHQEDARPHFWPLTWWRYDGPFSYWDIRHGANIIAPIEAAFATIAAIVLWVRRPGWIISMFVVLLLIAELRTVRTWLWFFIDS